MQTAGGLYYWAFSLGGPEWGPFLSWITGWFLFTGSVCGVATINNIGANLIPAMVVLNTGTALDGGYIASKEVTLSFLIGLTLVQVSGADRLGVTQLEVCEISPASCLVNQAFFEESVSFYETFQWLAEVQQNRPFMPNLSLM